MAKFGVVAQYNTGSASMIGRIDETSYAPGGWRPAVQGISLIPNPFTCCGLGTLTGFGKTYLLDESTKTVTFENKANFLEAIYALTAGRTHFVFVVNPTQKHGDDFKVMVEAGAKCIAQFPNNQGGVHSGYNLEIYLWNPKDAINVFLDIGGRALKAPPETKATKPAATKKLASQPTPPPVPPALQGAGELYANTQRLDGGILDPRPAGMLIEPQF